MTLPLASSLQLVREDAVKILRTLDLDEKVSLLSGSGYWHSVGHPEKGVPAIALSDGPHGIRVAAEGDNLGAAIADSATCFPTASALSCSWDVELAELQGRALASEASRLGIGVVLGPGVNIKRTPLGGRNFEYFSEDPYVSGRVSAGVIRGLQNHGAAASVKHFAVNNQEQDRFTMSAEVDPRALREIYLRSFEIAVAEGNPATVMTAYNAVNGVPASENPWLLGDVLRGEWAWDGVVLSDWGAVSDRVAALRAGLDLEMPSSFGIGASAVHAALQANEITENDIDLAALRIVQLVLAIEYGRRHSAIGKLSEDELNDLAQEVAEQSIVLLKNENATLPLSPTNTVALIGAFAEAPRFQGGGSSDVTTNRISNARSEILRFLPASQVTYAAGYRDDDTDFELIEQAAAVAAKADIALVFVGLSELAESEGFDREHLNLPASHLELLRRVSQEATKTVVVLHKGSVVEMDSWIAEVDAVLDLNLGGQAVAAAALNVLFGEVNPSGKTTETVPVRLEDTPAFLDYPGEQRHVHYRESIWVGYRYYDARNIPVTFAFGHGLSFTTFEYSDLELSVSGQEVTATFSVKNTGHRSGREIAQLYVSDPVSAVARPKRELRGFIKVHLEAGQTEMLTITLNRRDFTFWDTHRDSWTMETGDFGIHVGSSSLDIRLSETIRLQGDRVTAEIIDERTPTRHFLADSQHGEKLLRAARDNPLWTNYSALPPLAKRIVDATIEGMPLSTLAQLSGNAISGQDIDDLVERLSN